MRNLQGIPSEYVRDVTPHKRSLEGIPSEYVRDVTPEGDDWLSLISKSALKGTIGSLMDLPNLAAQGIEGLARGQAETTRRKMQLMGLPHTDIETPEIDILSSRIPTYADTQKYIKDNNDIDLEPRPNTAGQRVFSQGAELAGALAPWGLLGKAKLLNTVKMAGSGAGFGTTSGVLQEGGVNPLAADLISIVGAPSATRALKPSNLFSKFKNAPASVASIPMKVMGLSPKRLNVPAAQAARDLEIDLPAAVLANSPLTGILNQYIGKTPYFGEKLRDKYILAEQQTKNALKKIYDEIGPEKTDAVHKKIDQLYEHNKNLLPSNATELPSNLIDSANRINSGAAAKDTDLIKLLKYKNDILNTYNPGPSKKFGSLVTPYGQIKGIPIPNTSVQSLIDQKKSFNNILWNKGKTKELPADFRKKVDDMRLGTNKDIAKYGEKNPEWYAKFKEADKLYGQVETRAKIEKLLNNAAIERSTGTIKHASLSKKIHDPKFAQFLKQEVSPEVFTKIEKLGEISKAFAVKKKYNNPDPAGISYITNIINTAAAIVTGSLGLPYVAALGGAGLGITYLLTDKRFINLALKYAEKPNLVNSMPFNKRIKEVTGYTAATLSRELQRAEGEGQNGL